VPDLVRAFAEGQSYVADRLRDVVARALDGEPKRVHVTLPREQLIASRLDVAERRGRGIPEDERGGIGAS